MPGSWRTCREAAAIRNSSSTDDRREERQRAQLRGEHRRRQWLEPQLAPAVRRHALLGERPGRGLEDVPVADVAVREHVLDVGAPAPTAARCRTMSMAQAEITWSSSLISCSSVSSTSRGRVRISTLPRRTFSSTGMSSTIGITILRMAPVSMLSRYSEALARLRASPWASVHCAAAMSPGG